MDILFSRAGTHLGSGALAAGLVLPAHSALAEAPREANHLELPAISVTANPLDNHADALVTPVFVLHGEALSRQLQSTLGETLNGTPGVHSSYFGPNASRPVIRGLDGDRIRLMQNGIGMLDASSLSPDHAVPLDPLIVEQIDVVRGPAALQYGGSALGGVVNAVDNRIPREPMEGTYARAEARFGGAGDERNVAALAEAGNGRLAVHADVYRRLTDDLDIPGYARSARKRSANPQQTETRNTLTNSAAHGYGGALGVALTAEHGYAGIAFAEFDANYGTVAEPTVRIDMRSTRWDIAGEARDINPSVRRIKAHLARVDYQHSEIDAGVTGTLFKNKGWEGALEAVHGKLGPFEGALGAQFHRSDFSASGEEAMIPQTGTDTYAAYLYEEWPLDAFNSALKLSAGARAEHARVASEGGGSNDPSIGSPRFGAAERHNFTPTSYSAGALYRLDAAWTLTANLSHSERAPTYYELYSSGPHVATGQYELGRRTLSVEKSNGLDLQLRWRQNTGSFSVSAFYTHFDNYITPFLTGRLRDASGLINNVNGELAESQIQAVPAMFKGLELASKFRVYEGSGTLDLDLKGDYVRATDRRNGDPLPRTPPLRLGIGLDYHYTHLTARLDATRTFAQHRVANNELPTDGYTTVNAIVSYHLPTRLHLDAFLKASNLLDQEAREHTSVLKDIAPLGGRSVMLGLRSEF